MAGSIKVKNKETGQWEKVGVPIETVPTVPKWYSNKNLLDNSHFYAGALVDQRGGYVVPPDTPYYDKDDKTLTGAIIDSTSEYTKITKINDTYGIIAVDSTTYNVAWSAAVRGYVGTGCIIDRWRIVAVSRVFEITASGLLAIDGRIDIFQNIENSAMYLGKIMTISMMVDEEVITATGKIMDAFPSDTTAKVALRASNGSTYITAYMNSTRMWVSIQTESGVVIKAAKLELGDTQTLAHQDEDGKWVLNDIPNYGEELIKCQRHYEQTAWHCGFGIAVDTNYINPISSYFYKVQKRATPQITVNTNNPKTLAVHKVSDNTGVADAEVAQQTAWNTYMMAPRIYSPSGAFVKGELYRVIIPDNAYFISSDL